MSSDLEQRVSDADRDMSVAELREHAVAGRLTLEELSERIESAYAARTRGELERVSADLPAAPTARRAPGRWLVALIGDVRRAGRWRLAERTVAVLGTGDRRHHAPSTPPRPGAPVVHLRMFALIGDFRVEHS